MTSRFTACDQCLTTTGNVSRGLPLAILILCILLIIVIIVIIVLMLVIIVIAAMLVITAIIVTLVILVTMSSRLLRPMVLDSRMGSWAKRRYIGVLNVN